MTPMQYRWLLIVGSILIGLFFGCLSLMVYWRDLIQGENFALESSVRFLIGFSFPPGITLMGLGINAGRRIQFRFH